MSDHPAVPLPPAGGGAVGGPDTPRQAEERAWAVGREWRTLFDALGDGVCLLDHAGRVLRCNQALAGLLGKPFADILGRDFQDLLHGLPGADEEPPFRRTLRSGRRETAVVAVGDRRFRVAADPVRAAEGDVAGCVTSLVDLTDRVRAAEALAAADRAKDECLATLAHELRGPLAPLLNTLHLLRLQAHDPVAMAQARELAERQVRQLARLVEDLLDVSRVGRGKLVLRRESLEVAAVVAEAVETARPLIDARRQVVAVSLPPGPLRLEGDRSRLVQVLNNLLANSARYTPEGGHVWLSAGREGGEVVLRVRDDGAGIAADLLPRVFDLFVQGEPGSQGGLGIGLSLVKRLVEAHGGTVTASSPGLGRGAEFAVRLPAPPGSA